jgi:hypothetical protein
VWADPLATAAAPASRLNEHGVGAVETGWCVILVWTQRRTRHDAVLTAALLAAASLRAVQSEMFTILVARSRHVA